MAAARRALTATTICLMLQLAAACDTEHWHGCRVAGAGCTCAYGCRTDYPYSGKPDCLAAYREQSRNMCSRAPCARGNCLQVTQEPGFACRCEGTGFYGHRCEKEQSRNMCSRAPCARGNCLQVTQEPGFACRCEGTGFYGHRCEKACPTAAVAGHIYPYECIVI